MREKFNYVVNNCQELWRCFEKVTSVSWNWQTNGLEKKQTNSCSTLGAVFNLSEDTTHGETHPHTHTLTRAQERTHSLTSPWCERPSGTRAMDDSFAFLSRERGSLRNFAEVKLAVKLVSPCVMALKVLLSWLAAAVRCYDTAAVVKHCWLGPAHPQKRPFGFSNAQKNNHKKQTHFQLETW